MATAPEPTQTRYPLRAALRTAVQVAIPTVIALGIVVPQVVQIILEEAGESLPSGLRVWLLGLSAGIVAAAAGLTRIMAIPQVNSALSRLGLSATPYDPKHDTTQ